MTILITGATGLIGTQLSADLIAKGHTIHFLTTRKEKLINEPNRKGFLWNLDDNSIDDHCFNEVEVIIHLVGATVAKPWTKAYKNQIIESRVASTALLASRLSAIDHKVSRFISASGISIYPNSVEDRFDESSNEHGDGFLAKVVVAWEAAADQMASLGLSVTKVRTGVVFAKGEGALQKIVMPIKNYIGSPLGNGKQWLSWIHLDDISGVYTHLLDNEIDGVVNAVAPEPISNKALTKLIGKILNKPVVLPNVPAFVLKTVLGERASLVLEGQYVVPEKLLNTGYSFRQPAIKAALEDLLQ
ncbi:MAG: TIGR01777 family oxidoreductase [Gilvibacter sp.]